MGTYGAVVTTKYKALEAAASAGGPPVVFATFAVGDGNGAVPVLSNAGTGLVHQVYSAPVGSVGVNAANPDQIDIECPLPATDNTGTVVGPFFVREIAIYDANGNQVAAAITSFEKTTASEGQDSSYRFIVSIVVSDTNAVVITTPAGAYATQDDVTSIDANMADLLALITNEAATRLQLERHVRVSDERAFAANQRLRRAGL